MPGLLEEYKDQQTSSLKGFLKQEKARISALKTSAVGTKEEMKIFSDLIDQIKTAMDVGSKPKREDYITASKEITEIGDALGRVAGDPESAGMINPTLMLTLYDPTEDVDDPKSAIGIALRFIKKKKPSLPGAAVKSMGDKMTSAGGGFLKNIAMETFGGIPMGGAAVEWVSEKISGFGKSMMQGKKLSETELGIGRAFGGGAGEDEDEDAEENGGALGNGPDAWGRTGATAAAWGAGDETGGGTGGGGLGGTAVIDRLDSIVDLLQRGLFGSPPLLVGIAEDIRFMTDNMEDAESRRERLRDKGKKAGGVVAGKKEEDPEIEAEGIGDNILQALTSALLFWKGPKLLKAFKSIFTVGKLTSALKVASKGFRFVPIIGAIIAPIFDGILGWFKAEEWGTSKASAVIGAAIGGTDEGGTGAFWGALKGGAVGFAVGGPLGALAGVLIGAIAGWFGGERIAKALDKIGDFFSKEWTKIMDFFGLASEKDTKQLAIQRQEAEIKRQILKKKQKAEGTEQTDRRGNVVQSLTFDPEKLREAEEKLANTQAGKGEYTNAELENEITKWSDKVSSYKARETGEKSNAQDALIKLRINAENRLKKLQGAARGGVIINRPSYLPSSGVVVGEHPSYSGRGTPRDGGPEVLLGGAAAGAVIPLGADRASTFIDPVSRSIAGAVINQMAYDKIGHERGRGSMYDQPPAIVDASTIQNVTNNTIVRSPSPRGQEMHFERSDFVHKIA